MAIKIEWQSLPQREGAEGQRMFPRLTDNGSLSLEEICKKVAPGSSYDRATLKAAFTILSDAMAEYLAEGKTIELGDTGILQLTVGTPQPVTTSTHHPDRQVQVTGVRFVPSDDFLQRIGQPQFHATNRVTSVTSPSLEELASQTLAYLAEHPFITRSKFEQIFQLKRSTANVRLNQLIRMGVIFAEGDNVHRVYKPVR